MSPTKSETPSSKPNYVALLEGNYTFCLAAADDNARGKPLGDVEAMSPYKNIVAESKRRRETVRSAFRYIGKTYDSCEDMRLMVARCLEAHKKAAGGHHPAPRGGSPPDSNVSPARIGGDEIGGAGDDAKISVGEADVNAAIAAGRVRKTEKHCIWCNDSFDRENGRSTHERHHCPKRPECVLTSRQHRLKGSKQCRTRKETEKMKSTPRRWKGRSNICRWQLSLD